MCLADGASLFSVLAAGVCLDRVERTDPFQRFVGERRLIRRLSEQHCRATSLPQGRSSRTYVQMRATLVSPVPGASTGYGVSSACR